MKVDAGLGDNWGKIPERIKRLEAAGYDGVRTAEMNHDPFFPLLLAAEHSETLDLETSIAVAFARTPMVLANLSHDLNAYSRGRFTLGMGSQIRAHITKRFSMPWSKPAARMRELILAIRAIWDCWYDGVPLDFRGEFYTHTLMTPAFTPEDTQYGKPRIKLAAVGPYMTEVAGEVADGMLVHGFSNEKFIREVTLPAIEKGLAKAGRKREDFELSYSTFVVSGRDEAEFEKNKFTTKKRIAFYGSTPAYKDVFEIHGWEGLQQKLNAMSKQGQWDEMAEEISDEVLNVMAVVGEPDGIVPEILKRYGDIIDRTTANFEFADPDQAASMMQALRKG